MATPPGSGTMQPARPSTGQASRTNPQTEKSAARSQIKNTQANNRVNFNYTAESPAASVPSPITNTDLATQTYRGNTVSYLHYLERKIKVIISKIDSYKHDLENEIKLLNVKKSSYAHYLDRMIELLIDGTDSKRCKNIVKEIQQLNDKQKLYARNFDKKLKMLNDSHAAAVKHFENAKANNFNLRSLPTQVENSKAEKDSDFNIKMRAFRKEQYDLSLQRCDEWLNRTNSRVGDLEKQIKLLNAEKDADAEDLGRQIQLLSARKASYACNLVRQFRLLNARKNSYAHDLGEIINRFHEKKALCDHDIGREQELLKSKLAPFVGCLDRQLELLNSKLVSCGRDFNQQQNQLDSIITSYSLNVDNKMKLLNSDLTSYLGSDFQQVFVFLNLDTSMATLPGSGTMPPARPSTVQASRTNPQTEISAGRSKIKNTQANNRVNFNYTAESPAASVPSSTTNTDLATQVSRGSTVSYLHHLERKIKVIISKVDSYKHDLENEVKLLNSKKSSYAHNLDKRIQLLIADKDSKRCKDAVKEIQQLKNEQESHAYDLDKKLQVLNDSHAKVVRQIEILKIQVRVSKQKCCEFALERFNEKLDITTSEAEALDMQIKLMNAEKNAHAEDLGRQIQLLSAKKDSYARNLVRQFRLLNARKNSYAHELWERINRFHEKKALCVHDIGRKHELLKSKLAPFAGCLDRQLELLNSKIVSCDRDFNQQQNQLDIIATSYFLDVDNKMKLLKSDISYLGRGIRLLK